MSPIWRAASDTAPYLARHSDIVAAGLDTRWTSTNLLTDAIYEARLALRDRPA